MAQTMRKTSLTSKDLIGQKLDWSSPQVAAFWPDAAFVCRPTQISSILNYSYTT